MFLFAPRTLQLSSWAPSELRQDFVSRLRLSASPSDQLTALVNDWARELHQLDSPELVLLTKELGARLSECFKRRPWMQDLATERPTVAEEQFREVYSVVLEVRSHVNALLKPPKSKAKGSCIELLDQYLDHLVAESLNQLQEWKVAHKKSPPTWIENLLKEEFENLQKKGVSFQKLKRNKLEREMHVIRVSQLKKFFQSSLFVDVFKKETLKRIREPIAASAAVLAGITAATVEQMGGRFQIGMQGVALVCLGIAAFVIRDRLKDYFRDVFHAKLGDYLPDHHEVLVAGGTRIGEMHEWFHFATENKVPSALHELRREAALSHAEHFLKDDIFQYKRSISLEPTQDQRTTQVQEILRINLDRHLKFLDDSEKEIRVFTPSGHIESLSSHRSYPVYVGIVASCSQRRGLRRHRELDVAELFRVMIDKNGINRVECVGHLNPSA